LTPLLSRHFIFQSLRRRICIFADITALFSCHAAADVFEAREPYTPDIDGYYAMPLRRDAAADIDAAGLAFRAAAALSMPALMPALLLQLLQRMIMMPRRHARLFSPR